MNVGLLGHSSCQYRANSCNLFHIEETSRCLENRAKEHNSLVSSAIYKHSISNNQPLPDTSHFKITDQDNKQEAREAREAIHIGINNPALHHNTGKMYIPEIFSHLLGADRYSRESNQVVDSDLPQGYTHLTIASDRFSQAVCLAN